MFTPPKLRARLVDVAIAATIFAGVIFIAANYPSAPDQSIYCRAGKSAGMSIGSVVLLAGCLNRGDQPGSNVRSIDAP